MSSAASAAPMTLFGPPAPPPPAIPVTLPGPPAPPPPPPPGLPWNQPNAAAPGWSDTERAYLGVKLAYWAFEAASVPVGSVIPFSDMDDWYRGPRPASLGLSCRTYFIINESEEKDWGIHKKADSKGARSRDPPLAGHIINRNVQSVVRGARGLWDYARWPAEEAAFGHAVLQTAKNALHITHTFHQRMAGLYPATHPQAGYHVSVHQAIKDLPGTMQAVLVDGSIYFVTELNSAFVILYEARANSCCPGWSVAGGAANPPQPRLL